MCDFFPLIINICLLHTKAQFSYENRKRSHEAWMHSFGEKAIDFFGIFQCLGFSLYLNTVLFRIYWYLFHPFDERWKKNIQIFRRFSDKFNRITKIGQYYSFFFRKTFMKLEFFGHTKYLYLERNSETRSLRNIV